MQIIDGKKISEELLARIKSEVSLLPFAPVFCDIFVGEDFVSEKYVKMKARMAERVGMQFKDASYPSSLTTLELAEEIKKINEIPNMCGIIIQLPLPESINKRAVLDAINPDLDVDALGSVTSAKFYSAQPILSFPTALACLYILDSLNLDLKSKKIAVLGQGELVGRPVTAMLRARGLEVFAIDTTTDNKESLLKEADVIISGIGVERYIKKEMVKEGVVLIDAGTSESNGSLVGDVDYNSVSGMEGFISPVPGGVGPVTVAMLLRNVLQVAKGKNSPHPI